MFLEYGCWLELAYELFRLKKWNGQNGDSGTWQKWLTVNVGIFPRYSQMLREDSIFQNVEISFLEIYRRKEQLKFITNEIYCCMLLARCRPH